MLYVNRSIAEFIANYNNSQVSYRIRISNLQTHHMLKSKSHQFIAKHNSTVTVVDVSRNYSRGGDVDILLIIFKFLIMQCKWTITRCFTLSTPHRK